MNRRPVGTDLGGDERAAPLATPPRMELGALVWLAGLAVLTACVAAGNVRFTRMLLRNRTYDAPGFDAMLAQCADKLHIRRRIRARGGQSISPWWRCTASSAPGLLISPAFGWLSGSRSRSTSCCTSLRMSNTAIPLICPALHRFEHCALVQPACLDRTGCAAPRSGSDVRYACAEDHRITTARGYASTLLRIAQAPGAQNPRLVTALLGSATCIKRRIKMIVRYKKNSTLYTALALLLTIAVALTGCTAAMAAETNAAGAGSTNRCAGADE